MRDPIFSNEDTQPSAEMSDESARLRVPCALSPRWYVRKRNGPIVKRFARIALIGLLVAFCLAALPRSAAADQTFLEFLIESQFRELERQVTYLNGAIEMAPSDEDRERLQEIRDDVFGPRGSIRQLERGEFEAILGAERIDRMRSRGTRNNEIAAFATVQVMQDLIDAAERLGDAVAPHVSPRVRRSVDAGSADCSALARERDDAGWRSVAYWFGIGAEDAYVADLAIFTCSVELTSASFGTVFDNLEWDDRLLVATNRRFVERHSKRVASSRKRAKIVGAVIVASPFLAGLIAFIVFARRRDEWLTSGVVVSVVLYLIGVILVLLAHPTFVTLGIGFVAAGIASVVVGYLRGRRVDRTMKALNEKANEGQNGERTAEDDWNTCPACSGTGQSQCEVCHGSGTIGGLFGLIGRKTCVMCDGSGACACTVCTHGNTSGEQPSVPPPLPPDLLSTDPPPVVERRQ